MLLGVVCHRLVSFVCVFLLLLCVVVVVVAVIDVVAVVVVVLRLLFAVVCSCMGWALLSEELP